MTSIRDLKDLDAMTVGIDIGLHELFGDNDKAILQWLRKPRKEFNGYNALEHMRTAMWDVLEVLDQARNLK